MVEYIASGIVILIIFITIYHYNKGKGCPPKSCGNCRSSSGNLCHNSTVMHNFMSSTPVEIDMPDEPCQCWDWNGERDEKDT